LYIFVLRNPVVLVSPYRRAAERTLSYLNLFQYLTGLDARGEPIKVSLILAFQQRKSAEQLSDRDRP